jgi:hypothetical protein
MLPSPSGFTLAPLDPNLSFPKEPLIGKYLPAPLLLPLCGSGFTYNHSSRWTKQTKTHKDDKTDKNAQECTSIPTLLRHGLRLA